MRLRRKGRRTMSEHESTELVETPEQEPEAEWPSGRVAELIAQGVNVLEAQEQDRYEQKLAADRGES